MTGRDPQGELTSGAALPPLARAILAALLDRHEQPERRRVVRVRLTDAAYPAYFSPDAAAPRRDTNAALQRLADQGLLRLGWRKWDEGNWLETVDLTAERAADIYALLGRTPRHERDQALLALLAAQTPRAAWHAAFLAQAAAQIAAHRAVAPLDRNDPAFNRDLLQALDALDALQAPTLERTFSVRLFGDSKRFGEVRRGVVAVLRAHDPAAALYADDDRALLRAHLLDRTPEYVLLSGPLALSDATGRLLDLTPFAAGLGLPADTLHTATVADCRARAVVTVENLTSFHELLAVRPTAILAVYTGGFASPAVIALLAALRAARPALPLFHWGDLDAGGLRILAHLRSRLGPVQPLAMQPALVTAHAAVTRPLSADDQAALTALRALPLLADCAALIDSLLAAGRKLEQEAIAAAQVIAELQPVLQ